MKKLSKKKLSIRIATIAELNGIGGAGGSLSFISAYGPNCQGGDEGPGPTPAPPPPSDANGNCRTYTPTHGC